MLEELKTTNTWYLKNIILLISKWDNIYTWKVSISSYENNELEINIIWVPDKRNNILFDSNIEIINIFTFVSLNEDLLWLLFLISWIKKFLPKSINLTLPYFPYTTKDMGVYKKEENKVKISTDNWLLSLLQNSWISTIKTFDLWNLYVQNYSSIYIENITKDNIFIEEFLFFNKTTKKINIILLNIDDYILFNDLLGEKENINLILIEHDNIIKLKKEQNSLINKIDNSWKAIIYIFEKSLVKWNNILWIINLLAENLSIKELNLCVTHWIFAQWSYRKFNNLIEKYSFLNITTTNSINWYFNKINKEKITMIKLPFISKEKKIEKNT